MTLPITFYYPYPEDFAALNQTALTDWTFWSAAWLSRRRSWCLRTALSLHQSGYPVHLSTELPESGIVVLGPENHIREQFLAAPSAQRQNLFVVAIRADLLRCTFADVEIVQNGRFADNQYAFHVPHWPQPGLLPRDSARGSTVKTVAFKGYSPNLSPDFQSDSWFRFLASHNLTLRQDTNSKEPHGTPIAWHDYRTTDVILAVRPNFSCPYYDKPGTKLYNAWHAGVPAILGPEHAYKELRRSPLDYLEVTSVSETRQALLRLQSDPLLYEAMVENGRRRATEFTFDRITERWAEVLFEQIVPIAQNKIASPTGSTELLGSRVKSLLQTPPSRDECMLWFRKTRENINHFVQGTLRPWLGRKRRQLQFHGSPTHETA